MTIATVLSVRPKWAKVDVADLYLHPTNPSAGANGRPLPGVLALRSMPITAIHAAAPSATLMQLNGRSVYVNGNGLPPYSTCIDLAVVKRALEGDLAVLEANLDMLRVEPDTEENRKTTDLSAAKVTYCREALNEVIRALELCRGAGATFAVAHVTASPLLLSGGVPDKTVKQFLNPGAIGLNGRELQVVTTSPPTGPRFDFMEFDNADPTSPATAVLNH